MKEAKTKKRNAVSVSTSRYPKVESDLLLIKAKLSKVIGLEVDDISDTQAIIFAIRQVAKEEEENQQPNEFLER